MANKPKFLKNLLTTASIFTLAAFSTSSAMATVGVGITGAGTGAGVNTDPAGRAIGANAAFQFSGVVGSYDPTGGDTAIGAIDTNGIAGNTLTTGANDITLGPVVNSKASTNPLAVTDRLKLTILNGQKATFKGVAVTSTGAFGFAAVSNDLSGMGATVIGNGSTLIGDLTDKITQAVYEGTIDSATIGQGLVQINNGSFYFKQGLGSTTATGAVTIANKAKIQLGGTSNISGTARDSNYNLDSVDAELLLDAGAKLIGTNNGNHASIGSDTAGKGILTFLGNAAGDQVTEISIESNIGVKVDGATPAALKLINIGNVKVNPDGTPNIGAQKIIFNSTGKTDAASNKSELALSRAVNIFSKDGFSTTDGSGIVSINGANQTMKIGKFGDGKTGNDTLQAIMFNSDHELILQTDGSGTGPVANANLGVSKVTTKVDGTLTLGLGTKLGIISDIGEDGKKLKLVNIHSNNGAAAGATTVTLNAGKTIYAKQVDLGYGNVDNKLVLSEGSKIDGDVITTKDGKGNISVKGNSIITGGIVSGAQAINDVKFDVAGKSLTVGGDTVFKAGKGFNFDNDGTVVYALATPADTTYNGKTTIKTDGTGAIDASGIGDGKKFTVIEKLGTNGAMLKSLKGSKDGNLSFSETAQIKTVDVTGGNGTIELNKAGVYAFDNLVHDDGSTTLSISQDIQLGDANASKISTKTNKLKAVKFIADKTVTIKKATDIYTVDGITATGPSLGTITYDDGAGSAKIGGKIGTGAGNKLKLLKLGNNVQIEIEDKAYITAVEVGNDSTLTFDANEMMIGDLDGGGANTSTLVFNNDAKATYTGKIGAARKFKTIELAGIDLVVKGTAVKAEDVSFTNTDAGMNLDLTAVGVNVLDGKTITTAAGDKDTNRFHNILVKGDQNVDQKVGTDSNIFGSITMTTDDTLEVSTTDFYASAQTKTGGKGEFLASKDNATIYSIGDSGQAFAEAKFTGNNIEVLNVTNAKNVIVDAGQTVKFAAITGDKLNLADATATAIIKDGNDLNVAVANARPNEGIMIFEGSSNLNKDIGVIGSSLASVKFSGDKTKVVNSKAGIYAEATFGELTFNINNTTAPKFGKFNTVGTNLVFNSNAEIYGGNFQDTTFNMNTQQMKLTDNAVASGVLTLNTSNGEITVASGKTLDLSGVTSTQVAIDVSKAQPSDLAPYRAGESFLLINAENNANSGIIVVPTTGNVNVAPNKLIKWTGNYDATKGLVITGGDNAEDYIKNEFAQAGASQNAQDNAKKLADINNTASAAMFRDQVLSQVDAPKAVEAVERLTSTSAQGATEVMAQTSQAANSVLNTRMTGVNNAEINTSSESNSVAAGGDESLRHGIWFNPFYGQGTQKTRKGLSGYKVVNGGGTLGFDTLANDLVTIGIAGTLSQADIKHRDKLSGDKTKVDSLLVSLYAIQNFAERFSAQLVTSFGSSKVKTKERRVIDNKGYETATGKYDSMNYSAEATLAYSAKVGDAGVVIPEFTLGYNKSNDSGYTETGTKFQNRKVSKKAADKIYLKAGARAQMFKTNYNGVDLAPEARAFITHDMKGKLPKVDITLDGMTSPITPNKVKPVRTFYTVGFGLNARSGIFEYGVNGDATFANKYSMLTGSLTARVNI